MARKVCCRCKHPQIVSVDAWARGYGRRGLARAVRRTNKAGIDFRMDFDRINILTETCSPKVGGVGSRDSSSDRVLESRGGHRCSPGVVPYNEYIASEIVTQNWILCQALECPHYLRRFSRTTILLRFLWKPVQSKHTRFR